MYLDLKLPRVPKIQEKSLMSFCKVLKKQMVQSKSNAKEVSFEWSHHRISLTDSKVRATLHVSIIDSGTERVKGTVKAILHQRNNSAHRVLIILLLFSVKEGELGADNKIAMTVEHRLLQDLIYSESYSREVRPALHDNEVLRVAFSLALVQIVDVVRYQDFAPL